MRILIPIFALILVFLIGVRAEWVSVSNAALPGSDDRAYEALVLGRTRPDATSEELIDAAATRGQISAEQALLYGVYLACGDARLPANFRGQDARPPAKNILWEADVEWTSLAPETQQALSDFFVAATAGQSASTCGDELARLKADATVWWAPALGGRSAMLAAAR